MDKRVMKTKRAIHSAMTRLLSVKPIEEITVTELSNAAEINRKTFYSYYNSVYMVAEEMEDEIVERFEDTLRKIDFEALLKDPQTTFNTLARIIASDLDFYETILTNRNQVYFLQKIITSLKERIMALYFDRNSKDFELQEYMLEYIISGLVSVYQKWFKSGRKTDIEELSKYISMLAVNGVKSILTAPDEEKESR
ncbi:MAG: TetR/AcrR family transcriptional regulator [Lachnospiraceae bacterium]|nr:TetR/AcrR family transcriptional regulator [Lachnospiraceae bacterium]